MLGPIDLTRVVYRKTLKNIEPGIDLPCEVSINALTGSYDDGEDSGTEGKIDGVICGGETGYSARPMHPDWVRSLRDQCAIADVPFFFKQWGEFLSIPEAGNLDIKVSMVDAMNANTIGSGFLRVGHKKAGRLLDGREHNELPWSAFSLETHMNLNKEK
jgi:protein gp37